MDKKISYATIHLILWVLVLAVSISALASEYFLVCDEQPAATYYVIENVTEGWVASSDAPLKFPVAYLGKEGDQLLCVRACNEDKCSDCAMFWYDPSKYLPVPDVEDHVEPEPPYLNEDDPGYIQDANPKNRQGCFIGGAAW